MNAEQINNPSNQRFIVRMIPIALAAGIITPREGLALKSYMPSSRYIPMEIGEHLAGIVAKMGLAIAIPERIEA